jgi:syntaxin 1B/2/3
VEHAEKAADSARKARQKRIWCFWLCVLILIAIAAAIGIPLGLKNHH